MKGKCFALFFQFPSTTHQQPPRISNRHAADKWADRAGSALPFFRQRLIFFFS
jgi:hypothetical protein